jgi:hypothetical protein
MLEMDTLQISLTQRMIETRHEILVTDLSASEVIIFIVLEHFDQLTTLIFYFMLFRQLIPAMPYAKLYIIVCLHGLFSE